MDDEWITAADAYELVGKANDFRAADVICSRANDGIIVARAQTVRNRHRVDRLVAA